MHLSLNTRYCRIIKHLESNCSIIFQALVQYSKKDKNLNKNNIVQREDILKFYNLIHNDLIFRNFHFENGENFFSDIETTESFKLKDYGSHYKNYVKEFYDEFKQIFGIVSPKYLKSFLDKFMRLNAIDTPPSLTNLLRHSFLAEETQKAFIVLCKILQNTVKNKDFEIICLLVPEFEEAITLILKEKVTFNNIKFTHYLIGIVMTKLNFLKYNICYELKKYKDNHKASYLESPMLKTFITSVQTLLLIVLSEKVCKIEESLLFKVLILKNFLNYVSVRNIYRREYRNFFLLNFIPKCNFTSVNFGKLKFRQACTNIYWNSSFDTLNLKVLSDENYFTENLMKFLNIPYSTLDQPVFEGAVETIDKIRKFFVKIYL
ncbi:hypothetical protein TUBRATIS_25700 [Tubulinosema ratisbonensis]|uniref:Uncharacterized protein n=1 Tax=Tubulinosema ratisbonensis TaxID=291195 RepID=A0A437AIH8_9MICR|nr:hypothetical protein TUBRATIS_25700 [Tubulinosema ratisbonensis]